MNKRKRDEEVVDFKNPKPNKNFIVYNSTESLDKINESQSSQILDKIIFENKEEEIINIEEEDEKKNGEKKDAVTNAENIIKNIEDFEQFSQEIISKESKESSLCNEKFLFDENIISTEKKKIEELLNEKKFQDFNIYFNDLQITATKYKLKFDFPGLNFKKNKKL
jgi:hypothetical protein